jgi:hypothetical protein
VIPDRFPLKPKSSLDCDGKDFIYTLENESLHVNLRCTKIVVTSEDVVRSRIFVGTVHAQQVVPYVGAMFFFGEANSLCSIDAIESGTAFCSYFNVDIPPFQLPIF